MRDWSLKILGALEPVLSDEQRDGGVQAVAEFKDYLRTLVARRRREGTRDSADMLSTLIEGSELAGTDGDHLTELELLHNCIFLLNAGHETTTNLIGNSIDLLIRHPDVMRDLAAHPVAIETAVEEFLRTESSNQLGNRRATVDTAIGGVPLPAGTYVHLCIGAANRDPAQFPDPGRLDIRREPNATSPSASAFTPARGIRSPAWRPRSPSAGCCSASKASSLPESPRAAAVPAFADLPAIRSPCEHES